MTTFRTMMVAGAAALIPLSAMAAGPARGTSEQTGPMYRQPGTQEPVFSGRSSTLDGVTPADMDTARVYDDPEAAMRQNQRREAR